MPAKGLKVAICNCCGGIVWAKAPSCFHCCDLVQGFSRVHPDGTDVEWDEDGVSAVIKCAQNRDLAYFEQYWGNAYDAISACLRGLLSAAEGFDLICSDFSAIEAVVLAFAARCQWRMDVFNTHGKIYEQSAANVAGIPFEEMMAHAGYHDLGAAEWWNAKQTGQHHPLRKTLGKVCELASGYQGWIGAWKQFGADKFMTDEEVKVAILKWRDDSPEIVEFWGGQYRRTGYRQTRVEYYGVEGCAVAAVLNPGTVYRHTCIEFGVKDDILYVKLPSGRSLTYHKPRLLDSSDPLGNPIKQLTFMGVHPETKKWVLRDTYGGRMTENIIQGIARDIQANSIALLENAGYSVVLHVHDEIIAEVREGSGSIEDFERLMSTMPDWASTWPVSAKGGWRGKRYKKD
jgi:DNA polymerase